MSRTNKDTKKYREEMLEKVQHLIDGAPSSFKRNRKRSRRAKEKQAFREGKEYPNFKKCDSWDWW